MLEFSTLFVQSQRITALSREVANATFRDCGDQTDAELVSCVDNVIALISAGAGGILHDFATRGTVIASVYIPDPDVNENPPVVFAAGDSGGGGGHASRYGTNDLDPQFVLDQRMIVIGEAFYQYTSLTALQSMLNLLNLPSDLYGVTIY